MQHSLDFLAGHRDGATYNAQFDHDRLSRQAKLIYKLMVDGAWRSLSEISQITGEPEASVSARLRDLRKPRFGGFTVERRRRSKGTFEYKLTAIKGITNANNN